MSAATTSRSSLSAEPTSPRLISDRQNCIPLSRVLSGDDTILLLTPLVVPIEPQITAQIDPFESLGRAISDKYACVRHVPYSKAQGITGIHAAFVNRAKVVIFVLNQYAQIDGVSQASLAEMVGEMCHSRPFIVLACCEITDQDIHEFDFDTLLQTADYSRRSLSIAASMLCDGTSVVASPFRPTSTPSNASNNWATQPWDQTRDLEDAHRLWNTYLAPPFEIDRQVFGNLIQRDGYAKHFVVRDSSGDDMIGFCLTYTTYADSGDNLIGSIAAIVVREDFRHQGIGRLLHDEAVGNMHKIRGMSRIQIGSTFPRLLYGIPNHISNMGWFRRLGWSIDESTPGKGRLISDWLLKCSELPTVNLASAGLSFRPCRLPDNTEVINLVRRESERRVALGWFDQFTRIIDSNNISNVLLGFEGQTLVAAAITYMPGQDSSANLDLPWAGSIGNDIGGITCICIKGMFPQAGKVAHCSFRITDEDPEVVNRRDTILVRLLYICCKAFIDRGLGGVYVDGIRASEHGLTSLGIYTATIKFAYYEKLTFAFRVSKMG